MIPILNGVKRRGPFRASNFGLASQCRLRLLLESENQYKPDLPDWPESVLGIVIHNAIEEASKAGASDVTERIRLALENPRNYAKSSATPVESVPVSEVMPMSKMLRRIGVAQKTYSGLHRPKIARHSPVIRDTPPDHRKAMIAIERDYKTADGQLVGRVDRWERKSDGSVEITDFKSGRINTESGAIHKSYQLQLYAYALLLAENSISESITVSLAGMDGRWSEEFDRAAYLATRTLLDELVEAIPHGVEIESDDQARIGEACLYCKHRPRCPAYRREAPTHWVSNSSVYRLPNDTWGTVTQVQESNVGLLRIYLKDPTDRLVCVAHVPARLFDDVPEPGKKVFFFNLRASSGSEGEDWPTNFFIVDMTRMERSAHAAKIFLDCDDQGGP